MKHNITLLLPPKLWRRIMYKRRESEVDIGGDWGAGHVCNNNVIILEVFQQRVRTRRELEARVTQMNNRIFRNHSARVWRGNGMRL